MNLSDIASLYATTPQVASLSALLTQPQTQHIHCTGLQASAAPVLLSALGHSPHSTPPFVIVLHDAEEAGYFYNDLYRLTAPGDTHFLPSSYKRAVKHAQADEAAIILRTDVFTRLQSAQPPHYIVTYPEALAELVLQSVTLQAHTLRLHQGQTISISHLTGQLTSLGFRRVDYVYTPGEYAIRGSIIDIYSFAHEQPYRIDFFGDEIDSIRPFDVQSQLSQHLCSEAVIVPSLTSPQGSRVPFATLLPPTTHFVWADYTFATQRIAHIYHEGFSKQAQLDYTAQHPNTPHPLQASDYLLSETAFIQSTTRYKHLHIGPHAPQGSVQQRLHYEIHAQPLFHKQFEYLASTLSTYQAQGYTLYVSADSEKQTDRLREILQTLQPGIHFTPVHPTVHAGFIDDHTHIALLTDHQIFDRFHKYQLRDTHARNARVALSLRELRSFEIGDYIVHIDHGIGRFAGLMKIPTGQHMQEVIKINYQDGASVFVSIHALHKVSKYKGKEGTPPKVSKLGTGAWEKLKERTKSKLKDIARDLIQLYAKRREETGFAFAPDTFMQQEVEASFKYEDTPDQFKVTQEIKADMERNRPMDRLVCGDVGFGKTEIAIRAACKAVADNKQVAVLVPTTVLAYQHYNTFAARLKDFPVRVAYLSRACTPKETKQLLAALATGEIGILVGTHKLIGKQVKWHDLGLLIIDEEQKFGVAVKERLRALRHNIDTLTMSATPIPRTLQFSLMGARDLSVINTPPPNRQPIQTQLMSFSPEAIGEAVDFELSRNGQVFIVSNRIASLPTLAALVQRQVPDARVCIAHGQMPPTQMEETLTAFIQHDYDVLISTTIVENGIDIPNANTIIIDAAQHFGLSDLHQMRGRVGRSNRKAFCYLLSPPTAVLSTDARRRLEAIESFSDLGSGIHIAMQDLDIRGAGNLLGAEQSGFVADLGYEAYQKILREAVTELKNDEFSGLYADEVRTAHSTLADDFVNECIFESDGEIYFPETYVPGNTERMLLYRELDGLEDEAALEAYRVRLCDRFGPPPASAEALILVVSLRREARMLGIERLVLKGGKMLLYLVSNRESSYYQSPVFDHIIHYASQHYKTCVLGEKGGKPCLTIKGIHQVDQALTTIRDIAHT